MIHSPFSATSAYRRSQGISCEKLNRKGELLRLSLMTRRIHQAIRAHMLIEDTNPIGRGLQACFTYSRFIREEQGTSGKTGWSLSQTRSCCSCNSECTLPLPPPPSSKAHVCSVRFQRLSSARSQGDRGRQKWGRRQRLCKSVGILNLGY